MSALNRIAGALGMRPKRETRASQESFTDQQIALISSAARGNDAVGSAVACRRGSGRNVFEGFSAGGSDAAKLPDVRDYSDLVSTVQDMSWHGAGQFVCDIEIVSGAVVLQPAAFACAVRGNAGPIDVDLDPEYVRSWLRPHPLPTERRDCEYYHRPHGVAALGGARTVAKPRACPLEC